MTLGGWPFAGLDSDIGRLRNEVLRGLGWQPQTPAGVFPPVNIYDDGGSFLVRAELPGVDRDSLEVTARGEQLTLRGKRVVEPAETQASYHRREREGGRFRRALTLPLRLGQQIDQSRISARIGDGVLVLTLPKAESALPKRIQVKTAD